MDPTHSQLLKAIARNLNAAEPIRVYSDYLQETDNPGWWFVANYPPRVWPLFVKEGWHWKWKLPWLKGDCTPKRTSNWRTRLKEMLTLYAEGRVSK